MNDPTSLLQLLIVGMSGWTIREVYRIARELEAMKQRLKDLPCGPNLECPENK
jgi:hypothetical protein